ncbi:MAG: 16S rRNA (adenine(1518)-N(6)/adenine(1519)-N(6))-dimethyltransferase RsmA [Myxococcales bacterium]|nr:16S rRNA (adenine(1518)-N(6)/adenine(1519)-N(6))-dimethyltransferase RsmA [Myxococcales bacterium]MDD9971682.1 16S rRNA (adenine(1518)-N(6)/adenine(1519)-N(6))-dimethyltransferase RsmA [Myxococcales bacterium]
MFTDPRSVLARHGLTPKRGLSQNFLCSPQAIERIASATGVGPGDMVVELGPGCGTLTEALLRRGATVVAIERDQDMRRVLAAEFDSPHLTVRAGDATTIDYGTLRAELGQRPQVVGNLPYSITGAILRRMIDHAEHLASAVLMVQREVAERLYAAPGGRTYGGLTVFTRNVFEVERVTRVAAGAFFPRPKVESAVVRLLPRAKPLARQTLFAPVVRAAFQARRKTLRNALRQMEGVSAEAAERTLESCQLPPRTRAEELDVDDFDRIARALEALRRPS